MTRLIVVDHPIDWPIISTCLAHQMSTSCDLFYRLVPLESGAYVHDIFYLRLSTAQVGLTSSKSTAKGQISPISPIRNCLCHNYKMQVFT